MSININVNGMQCYADRAAAEKRKINRLLMVREQSNELAHKLRNKVRLAQEQELKKIQEENKKELGEWKRRNHAQIQAKIDECIGQFGNAHIAAIDASCEENEFMRQGREEKDLMAAMRGRKAMLQVQREREKKAEERLMKKKKQNLKTTGTQADFLTQHGFKQTFGEKRQSDKDQEDEIEPVFVSKPNVHKHSVKIDTNYNAQNYTTNSVDSSNNCDSDEAEDDLQDEIQNESESDLEFNQISNLLFKKQQVPVETQKEEEDVISITESSSSIEIIAPKKLIKKPSPKKKGIMKKSPNKKNTKNKKIATSPIKKSKTVQADENRVRYVDFTKSNYETTYVPSKTLITRSEKPKMNARQEAQVQTDDYMISKKMNAEILKQLTEIRSQEALEKEKIRRDYERLRLELDELSKLEQEAKTKTNEFQNLTRDRLLRKENVKQRKMNEAMENAMKGNILTRPPVDLTNSEKPSVKQKSNVTNVAVLNTNNFTQQQTTDTSKKKSNEELNNIVKVERLKDLLEKINHQKRLLLNEIEKNDDVPGPDLEKVMECLKKLEDEKAQLQQTDGNKINELEKKKIEQLTERERKIREREERLEKKLRELFKQQKEATKPPVMSSSSSSTSVAQSISDETSSATIEKKTTQPPVEIIIKVQQPKSPYKKKSSKSYRCIDTLNREPGKAYPKTPIKKKKVSDFDTETTEKVLSEKREEHKQKQTQTSPINLDAAPKPILKNSKTKQISISPTEENRQKMPATSIPINIDDFSTSTIYRDLPAKINIDKPQKKAKQLNPNLMHYITRLLGMNKDIGNQLNVDVSSVSTPGSSTINTSGNVSSVVDVNVDDDRLNRLQKFIDDNYSFLSEINESLERTQMQQQQQNEYELEKIKHTWEEALRKKKPKSHDNQSKASSSQMKSAPTQTRTLPSTSASAAVQDPKIPHIKPKNKTLKQSIIISQQPIKQRPHSVPIQSRPQITTEEMEKVTKYLESKMMNNYKEYTDNCQKRINELTKMMEQVRQEKMKLIENSLSSNECNNFTEYKDIVQKNAGSSDQKDSPPSNRDDPPSEEINNILKTQSRPFGMSKDSGIASSRPVTSSDFRDSPDVRVTSEENNNTFQPIAKIIHPSISVTTDETVKNVSQIIKQHEEKKRLLKPPLSIKSFSPQVDKQHEGHELSTIAEIETPSASKVNIVPDESLGVADLHSFPNFEEYAKKINVVAEKPQIENITLPDLKIKTFVEPNEYGIVELSKDDNDNESHNSSLIDIQTELKNRGIFSESFNFLNEDQGKENLLKEDDKTTPITTHHTKDPTSPKRKPAQSKIVIKTPDNGTQIQIITTPTKAKKQRQIPESHSPNSNDTLSGIHEIENDLQTVGMGWAANVLKRTEDTQNKKSSSSSDDKNDEIKININLGTSSSSSSDGRPLNLKEFLRREILSKTNNLTDDSSLSSRFLKSLLNASSDSTSSSSNPKSDSTSNPKLRTSTPVRMSSEYLATKTAASSQMFAGVESMSTVKDSSSNPSEKSEKN